MNPYKGQKQIRNQKYKIIDRIRQSDPTLAASIDAVRLDWYQIRNSANSSDTTEVFIYDEIGGYCGLDASTFVQELNAIDTDRIVVRINSPGGSLFDGIAIYNSLVQHSAHVTTRVDALAASAASIIAMAGNRIEMMIGSQLMIHNAMGMVQGNAVEMREMADFLEKQSRNIAGIYAAHAGGNVEEWQVLMDAETWMFADEAVELKLAHAVYAIPPELAAAPDDPEEDDEEDGDGEDDTEPGNAVDTDDMIQLMHKRHPVTARGYKYLGRKNAPAPKSFADLIDQPSDQDSNALSFADLLT